MWIILLLLVLSISLYMIWTRKRFYMLMFQLPGPLGYPLIGMAHKFIRREDILPVFDKNLKIYGPVFLSWLGPFPFLVVSEPQIVQDIMTSPNCDKGLVYDALDDGTGKGLFSLKSDRWSTHRKLLNPAFSNKVLISFLTIFNTSTNELIKKLGNLVGNGEHDLTQIFQHFTLNIAALTTMGKKIMMEDSEESSNLLHCYQCVLENMAEMCFSPWLKSKLVRRLLLKDQEYENSKQQIRQFIKNLINERCAHDEDNEPLDKKVFINLAIDLYKKGYFSLQEVEDECNVIVFGAFETTANSLVYTLLLLAMFPQYQDRLYDEVQTVFRKSQQNHELTYEQIQQLFYMDMVINEAMRVIAPVPMVSRETLRDTKLSNGVIIPKGVQIVIDIFHMQRRKDIWGNNAHTFDPDHFLPSNLHGKHPYAFMPFTKGNRNCIGWRYGLLSMKVTLAQLINKFRFETNFKFEELYFVEDITVKLKTIPLLKIHKR